MRNTVWIHSEDTAFANRRLLFNEKNLVITRLFWLQLYNICFECDSQSLQGEKEKTAEVGVHWLNQC